MKTGSLVPFERIEKLIAKHRGNMSAMARELGVSLRSLRTHVDESEDVKDLLVQQRAANTDAAEAKLLELIDGYKEDMTYMGHYKGEIVKEKYKKNHKPDIAALTLWLKAHGKKLGYGDDAINIGNVTVDKIAFVSVEPKS